ncbi:lipolytic enzyme [Thelonectria olida]|uniref:Lipolytic enzyme n=1 Tax=Thelonectria olida TaxID=1576542 RepID=A0A9P8VPK7_9HYPO|nr:lipolytic enzyme [Thelonectria olida]
MANILFNFSLKAALQATLAFFAVADALPSINNARAETSYDASYVTVWGASPQLTEPNNLPPPPFNQTGLVFEDTTIRQTVKVSLKTDFLRLQVSNVLGGTDLTLNAVTIALSSNSSSAGGSEINEDTLQDVAFSGSSSFIVPAGALAISDSIHLSVQAESIVTISIYLQSGQAGNRVTSHPGSRTTSWLIKGNHVRDASLQDQDAVGVDHWYLISALEGRTLAAGASTIAMIGDSITDGRGSTTNTNNRWPDQFLSRLQRSDSTSNTAILNQASGGNRVLGFNGYGQIDRDVIAHSGVKYCIVLIGINDIGTTPTTPESQQEVVQRLIEAYRQIITRLHRHDIFVYGGTMTPPGPKDSDYGHPEREKSRQAVNKWIRQSGVFDEVIDFDAMVKDPSNAQLLRKEYDSGDGLHLNPRGYKAMADGIDLGLFS